MQHADRGDERLEAQGEVAVARLAIDSGNLAHAAEHLADAMVADPQLPELHEALAEFCARAGGPAAALEHFPLDGQVYLGTVVCRAHVQAAAGDWDSAVSLLASAIRHAPDRPWADTTWLARADLPALLAPDGVAQSAARIAGVLPDPAPEELRPALRPFEDLVRRVVVHHRDHPVLLAFASGLIRRLGDTPYAVDLAERAHRLAPQHLTAVLLGNALRADGQPDRALTVWQAAHAARPDSYLAVDIAELYAATGRPAEGLPWLDRVLATEPDHPKAGPARHGVRHGRDGGTVHLLALADHLRDHPDHEYAAELLARHSREQPWLGAVHGTGEATVNALHRFLAAVDTASGTDPGTGPETGSDTRGPARIDLTVSALEPPSSLLAVRLAAPDARVTYRAVLEPDPRTPVRPSTTRIWDWDGTVPRPAVPAPSDHAAALVRDTAEVVWSTLPAAYDHAVRLAGLPPADLLGVLAHPPAPREDEIGAALRAHHPELWIRAVQAFACLGIAHHRTDQPWADADRHRILADLLLGPEDWVAEAAGFALVTVAWVHPETRADVGRLLAHRLAADSRAHRQRAVTILPSVCRLLLACPWAEPDRLAAARELLDRLTAEDAESGDTAGTGEEAEAVADADAPGTVEPGTVEPADRVRADDRPSLLKRLFRRR
ncbi:hypothetical protein GCM10010441_67840 [Kitasatospora paracochleata]|uniref:Tetratricopeptide (TPR) repeat protein n=1 Tax=Kitasatospora paracochleata TaxID=58354 RepID=A0ABT1J681_9ACTN|nr:hypothetical protein [Kitasatospora paracochleata]MCP2312628.1 tetratricopeptide (TPR) repeat protein [Kitasatospora paracochleata]